MKKVLFIFMFFMFCSSVFAAHLDLERINGVYSSQYNIDTGEYHSYGQKKYIMDGRVVYCVEPGIDIMTREYGVSSNLLDSGFSNEIINKLSLIGYFGYDYPTHRTDNYFLAAQELVWELIGNNEIHFTTGINNSGDRINIEKEKNEIMNLVNSYSIKPSFDSTSISGAYNDEIVLVDNNQVLSNYDVVSSNNPVRIDGNRLIIKVTNLGLDNITLMRKKYDDVSSLLYHANNSQDFMLLRVDSVISSSIDVLGYVPYSNIHINKVGSKVSGFDDEFIYSDVGLNDVLFGLYAGEDIYDGDRLLYYENDFIEELITKDGDSTSRNLPNGKYYLKELKTDNEYVLDDSIIPVVLNNSFNDIYTYELDLKNDRKKISVKLKKTGEVFDGISYVDSPLGGVVFGLYNSDDIYGIDGKLVKKHDSLIYKFVTDSFGNIYEELDVPFGDYYFKEISGLSGYRVNNNTYKFSVMGDDVDMGTIKNELIKDIMPVTSDINKPYFRMSFIFIFTGILMWFYERCFKDS